MNKFFGSVKDFAKLLFSFVKADPEENGKHNKKALISYLVCLFLAICSWFYVMQVDSPIYEKEFSNIPVTIDSSTLQNSISVINDEAMHVDVTLKGKKTALNNLGTSEIIAYIDASNVSDPGTYNLNVDFQLPAGITVVSKYPDAINVYLERRVSKTVPVEVVLENYKLPKDITITHTPNISEVIVTGPETVIDSIEKGIVKIEPGEITGSFKSNNVLKFYTSADIEVTSKYVSSTATNVTVSVNAYSQKDMSVVINYKNGFFNDENVSVTVKPSSIRVFGLVEDLNKTDHIDVTVDEKQLKEGINSIPISSPNFEIADEKQSVELDIHHKTLTTDVITVSNINLLNAPSGAKLVNNYINITLRGESEALKQIDYADISIDVDLSNIANNGIIYAAATVNLPEHTGIVYEVGDYRLQVQIP